MDDGRKKLYIQVEGGSRSDILEWFSKSKCPFSLKHVEQPDDIVESMYQIVTEQAKDIEDLIVRTANLEKSLEEQIIRAEFAEHEVEELLSPSSRRPPPHFKLPDERPSITHSFRIGISNLGKGQITAGYYPGTRDVGEVFIKMDTMVDESTDIDTLRRQVSDLMWFLKSILDQLAIAVSIGLQRGIPLGVYVRKFMHTKFSPDGMTQNKEIPRCSSIVDYLFQWLASKFDAQ